MRTDTKDLLPCPFCGSTDAVRLDDGDSWDFLPDGEPVTWAVVCDYNRGGCGGSGGFRDSKKDAIAAWNQAADRLAALEAELASLRTDRDGAAEACRMLQEDKARLEQDNARLREALAPVANSHTDNEGTDRPVWWILDPQQMMRACPHRLYSMFHGPFWSREEAERFFKATRYRYGSRAVVYCGSAHQSPQMRALFDSSAALAAGGDQ